MYVAVDSVNHEALLQTKSTNELSTTILARVAGARLRQKQRFDSNTRTNSSLTNTEIKHQAGLQPKAQLLLNKAAAQMQISARSYMRTIKVARTIADLENSDYINEFNVAEALQYRYQPIQ